MIDFGTAGVGDPANDVSCLLLNYGESFVSEMAETYPHTKGLLRRARFLARTLELEWAAKGLTVRRDDGCEPPEPFLAVGGRRKAPAMESLGVTPKSDGHSRRELGPATACVAYSTWPLEATRTAWGPTCPPWSLPCTKNHTHGARLT